MSVVIMSIRPKYAESILDGRKRWEFRKHIIRKSFSRILIYETSPVKAIVGEFCVFCGWVAYPSTIWRQVKNERPGLSKTEFDRYYSGCKSAVAMRLCNVFRYEKPIPLPDGMRAPQSYAFRPDEWYDEHIRKYTGLDAFIAEIKAKFPDIKRFLEIPELDIDRIQGKKRNH